MDINKIIETLVKKAGKDKKLNNKEIITLEDEWKEELKKEFFNLIIKEVHKLI